MTRKKLTIEMGRRLADILLRQPKYVLRKPATPAPRRSEIDPDELMGRPELRWFDCPAYDHCLYIACLANWASWSCLKCPVRIVGSGNGELDKQE